MLGAVELWLNLGLDNLICIVGLPKLKAKLGLSPEVRRSGGRGPSGF